jgi:hypothetical protein
VPPEYQIAQRIDSRLGLHDAISTAWHFERNTPPADVPEEVIQAQAAQAQYLATTADPADAVPWRAPKRIYTLCVIAAAAGGLFILRYGLLGSLDLRQPIVEAVADFFQPSKHVVARAKKNSKLPGEDPLGIALDEDQRRPEDLDAASDAVLDESTIPNVDNLDVKSVERAKQTDVKAQADEGDSLMEGEEGEESEGKPGSDKGSESGSEPGSQGDEKNGSQSDEAGSGQENSSLLDKMRDAMANLMSKLKIPPQAGKQSQQSAKGQQGGQRDQASNKGKPGEGKGQGKGSPNDDPNSDMKASGDQQAQAGDGKSADKNADQGASSDPKSGMGKQDGSKDIQNAEQQAAMGKLSEIFGRRAANITGEVMVEVTSSRQQNLRTAYGKSTAQHKDSGGEVRRDEVPLELQHYVQQYFEQVRKGESAPKSADQGETKAK